MKNKNFKLKRLIMKDTKSKIIALVVLVVIVAGVGAGVYFACKGNSTPVANTDNATTATVPQSGTGAQTDSVIVDNETPSQPETPILPEQVELSSGKVVEKSKIDEVAKEYIPDSLPETIENMEDLIKYNDYVETLEDGDTKEMLLLKMQMFLESMEQR